MQQMFGNPPPPPPDKDARRTLHFNILNVKVPRGGEGVDVEVPADTKILNAEISSAENMRVGTVTIGLTEVEQAQADMQVLAYENMLAQQAEQAEAGDEQAAADFLRELGEETMTAALEDAGGQDAGEDKEDE